MCLRLKPLLQGDFGPRRSGFSRERKKGKTRQLGHYCLTPFHGNWDCASVSVQYPVKDE